MASFTMSGLPPRLPTEACGERWGDGILSSISLYYGVWIRGGERWGAVNLYNSGGYVAYIRCVMERGKVLLVF